jgi:hypothetical protein
MGKLNTERLDEVKRERAESERRQKVEAKRSEIKSELAQSDPPADAAGMADRQRKVEIALGLKDPDV